MKIKPRFKYLFILMFTTGLIVTGLNIVNTFRNLSYEMQQRETGKNLEDEPISAFLDNVWRILRLNRLQDYNNDTKATDELIGVLSELTDVVLNGNRSKALLFLADEVKSEHEAHRRKILEEKLLPAEKLEFLLKVVEKWPAENVQPRENYVFHDRNDSRLLRTWQLFQNGISPDGLYREEESKLLTSHLLDLQHSPIVNLTELPKKGTQLKFLFHLRDGSKALFKPMKVPRHYEEPVDSYYYNEVERHHAEIAAFHLDRLLGFRRVPPVTGRKVNMEEDIYKRASGKLKSSFSKSPTNNMCMYGECSYFCDRRHPICGVGNMIEGSMASFLPSQLDLYSEKSPWRRTYSESKQLAEWQLYPNTYCEQVRNKQEFSHGRKLLDVVDLHIFDFLSGNQDRHHLVQSDLDNDTFLVAYDNGRGFGRPRYDDKWILAPLSQCCVIRATTLARLVHFESGPHPLSSLMRKSLKSVPLEAILTELQLESLDRRVKIILSEIYTCIENNQFDVKSVIKGERL